MAQQREDDQDLTVKVHGQTRLNLHEQRLEDRGHQIEAFLEKRPVMSKIVLSLTFSTVSPTLPPLLLLKPTLSDLGSVSSLPL